MTGGRARASPARLLLVLAAFSLVLHLPGLVMRLFNSDEASIATMAMVIDHGGTLYHQTADRKPPVVPYLYAAVFRLTGSRDIRPVRALGALALAATAALLVAEARRRYRSETAAIWCGVIFLLSTVAFFPADSQAAGFELFMLLPMTAAVVAAGRGRPLGAGLWLALACLCKQTAVTTALPAAYLLFKTGGWRPVLRAGLVAAGVIGLTALAFGPGRFLLWTVTGNGGYLALRGSLSSTFLRGLGMTSAFLGANVAVALLCAWRARQGRVATELWLWLAGAGVAVVMGLRFFGHYYLQLLPALALISAAAVPESAARARRWVFGAVALPAAGFLAVGFLPTGTRPPRYQDVAERVKALTDEDDTVFVWGQFPELYWASGREPATRFVHTGFLTGNTGGRSPGTGRPSDGQSDAWTMLADDMAVRPPDLVLDTGPAALRGSQFYPLRATALWPTIRSEYRWVSSIEGVTFYRRVGLPATRRHGFGRSLPA